MGHGGLDGIDDEESLLALDRAIEGGCNFFDTAFAYGEGRSERLLGRRCAAIPGPPLRRHQGAAEEPALAGRAETPASDVFPFDHVVEMTRKSLANLGLERIHLQQLHVWSDAWVDDDGWRRAAEHLKKEGLVEGFGISVNRWEPTNVLAALRTGLVDAVQVVYNIFDQAPEDELFPACRERNVAVIARVPFDEGSLTGTMTADDRWPRGRLAQPLLPAGAAAARRCPTSIACVRSFPREARSPSSPCGSSSTTRPSPRRSRACAGPATSRPTCVPETRRPLPDTTVRALREPPVGARLEGGLTFRAEPAVAAGVKATGNERAAQVVTASSRPLRHGEAGANR